MTKEQAYQVLGLEEGATLTEAKHARNILLNKYQPGKPEEDNKKYAEAIEAFRVWNEKEDKNEANKPKDDRPPRNKDKKSNSNSSKQKEKEGFFSKKKKIDKANEKAFDELMAFKNIKEEELEKLNIKVRPEYKKEFLDINNRGIISSQELMEEQKRLENLFNNIIDSAKEYDKLQETIKNAKKQIEDWGIDVKLPFIEENKIDPKYRGYTDASEFKRICLVIENKIIEIKENIKELELFLAFIEEVSDKIKKIDPKLDIEELKSSYLSKKGKIDVEYLKNQRKIISEKIEAQEKVVHEFKKFFEETEKRIKLLYNSSLTEFEKYYDQDNTYQYTEKTLNNVKKAIENYEKTLQENGKACNEFIAYYMNLSEKDKELFEEIADINENLKEENRNRFTRTFFEQAKKEFWDLKEKRKKEKEYLEVVTEFNSLFDIIEENLKKDYGENLDSWRKYRTGKYSIETLKQVKKDILEYEEKVREKTSFIAFFKEKEQQLKQYGINLNKWKIYSDEEKIFSLEDYEHARNEILIFEQELQSKKENYLRESIYHNGRNYFEEVIATESDKTIQRIKKEKEEKEAYLKFYEEFIIFFDKTEERLKKLCDVDLSKWSVFKSSNKHSIEELKQAQVEIKQYEKDIKEKVTAYNEFLSYYKKLSEEEQELYKSIVDIDNYLSIESKFLYSKEIYDELKDKVLKYKQEKELQEKQKRYRKIKQDFINFFKEKEKLFRNLYATDLYKWRKYSLEENDFLEEDYYNVKQEISSFEDLKENERMTQLTYLQRTLNILNINIEEYLKEKKQDIKTISIKDLTTYNQILFNTGYTVARIMNLNGGREKLNIYLEKQQKTILELTWNELEELYKSICLEVAKEEEKNKSQEKEKNYNNFKKFYNDKIYVFKNLYGENLSKWDSYLKEENKDSYTNDDYKQAINEIKEEEMRLEEVRMSLAFKSKRDLKSLSLDFSEYLSVRKKDLLSVSIFELNTYLREIDMLNVISSYEEGIELLTKYLNENNIKLIQIDSSILLAIYEKINIEQKDDNLDNFEEYNHFNI